MRTPIGLLLFAHCLVLSVGLDAQTPYLVRDINTSLALTESSSPGRFTAHRNRIFFVATTDAAGTELWSSDGTAGGTSVLDILPGSASSNAGGMIAMGDVLLFTARDVDHGIEIWTTDGTATGTRRLLDINPGPNSAQPFFGIAGRHGLFFSADDGTRGRELWITDGTEAGTRLVKDIVPGPGASSPRSFVALGDHTYFFTGSGLWRTDGTESGTVLIATVGARNPIVAGSLIFFEGYSATTGWDMWVSDGTESGTRMLPEIRPGAGDAFASQYGLPGTTALGDRVIFVANDGSHGRELWTSDGTAEGTRMVRDLTPGAVGTWDIGLFAIVVFGSKAWFAGRDVAHGTELWVTDGTDAGTNLFLDIVPGPASSAAVPRGAAGGRLFFTATETGISGPKLWVTDGTVAGTRVLKAADGKPFGLSGSSAVAGGKFYFAGTTPLAGTEPWTSDGTDAGTRMIANLAGDRPPSSRPRMLAAAENLLFFHATEGLLAPSGNAEASLWRSDGTASGTFKLRETGQHPTPITGAGPFGFFLERIQGYDWQMTDGTVEGTGPADEFMMRFGNPEVLSFFPSGETLFAIAGSSFETSLWRTVAAADAPAVRLGGRDPRNLIEVAGHHMFLGRTESSVHDRGLWITDGTPEGTYAVVPDLGSSYSGLSNLVNAAGTVYFAMQRRDETMKLWKSDGTVDGTLPVMDFTGQSLVAAEDRLYFIRDRALWTSDGTEPGTTELLELPSSWRFNAENLATVGNRLVFVRYHEFGQMYELWGSDGTPAGTKLLKSLQNATGLTNVEGLVYFGADDEYGIEPWTTDGTPEGTKRLADLNPGPGSSYPSGVTKLGNTLYLSAYTEGTGDELWAIPLTGSRLSIRDTRTGEGDAGTKSLRFVISLAAPATGTITVGFATSDGTARAGEDYVARSGNVSFAPGEITKAIDVQILGDDAPENNETFFVTLQHNGTARIAKGRATGIVDDDDAAADVRVSWDLTADSFGFDEGLQVTNDGPRTATDVLVTITSVPEGSQTCWTCSIPQLAAGGSAAIAPPSAFASGQVYRSAIVHARQQDPDPTNDRVSWTITRNEDMAMNAAYLSPGATATVSVMTNSYFPTPAPVSSDPATVSISAGPTKIDDTVSTFTVTAHKEGTASISVGGQRDPLNVIVAPAGGAPRWPDALRMEFEWTSTTTVDNPLVVKLSPAGSAPFTGARATGTVIASVAGVELARTTLTGTGVVRLPVYFRSSGPATLRVDYSGDESFLPQTKTLNAWVNKGKPVLTGRLERVPDAAGTYELNIEIAGSPVAAPLGFVQVAHAGSQLTTMALVPSSGGVSTAKATLTGLLVPLPTVSVSYLGDALYEGASKEITAPLSRRRTVRP